MRFSNVKPKHIYNVIFDDVRECEFDKKHLALVLKKNNDKKTCIVMPLTSEKNGSGSNKFKVGYLECLPKSLRSNNTYAVYNQIRTLNVSRFIALKEGDNIKEAKVDDELFFKLLDLGTSDITFELNLDECINFYKKKYEDSLINKMIDCAYEIKKLRKKLEMENSNDSVFSKIEELRIEVLRIIETGIEYKFTQKQLDDGIDLIINDVLGKE